MSKNGVNFCKSLMKQLTPCWGNGNRYLGILETGNVEYKRDDIELWMQMILQEKYMRNPILRIPDQGQKTTFCAIRLSMKIFILTKIL